MTRLSVSSDRWSGPSWSSWPTTPGYGTAAASPGRDAGGRLAGFPPARPTRRERRERCPGGRGRGGGGDHRHHRTGHGRGPVPTRGTTGRGTRRLAGPPRAAADGRAHVALPPDPADRRVGAERRRPRRARALL